MTTYEFQSSLFRNSSEVAAAIASEWMSAGGLNGRSDIRGFFADATDEALAGEAIGAWGLLEIVNQDEIRFEDAKPETWLESRSLDHDALVRAFAELRAQYA